MRVIIHYLWYNFGSPAVRDDIKPDGVRARRDGARTAGAVWVSFHPYGPGGFYFKRARYTVPLQEV